MMSHFTVTGMASCDVSAIACRCKEPRTVVACHILKKNLNGNNYDTLAEYTTGLKIPVFSHMTSVFCTIETQA